MFRNLASVVNRSMGGNADMSTIWPLHNDPKKEIVLQWGEDELADMVKKANDQFALIKPKNGRT